MARSKEDIISSMQEEINSVDPTIDVSKGPVFESVLTPFGVEFSTLEAEIEHLAGLYQLEDTSNWTLSEIIMLGQRMGLSFNAGEYSQGYLTFYCYSRPTTDQNIPLGTLASTENSTYVFQTIEDITMYAATIAAYYNASTRRYEIKVPAQATVSGTEYNIRTGRIKVMMTPVTGFNGVINSESFEGGQPQQTIDEFINALRYLSLGNSLGTPGGISTAITRLYGGAVYDAVVVTPADIGLFERLGSSSFRQALDIYVLGSRIGLHQMTYTTTGAAENTFILEKQPAISISTVMVDGLAVAYSFVSDITPEVRGSISAQDHVVLTVPVLSGSTIFISYTYNKLIEDLQAEVNTLKIQMFETDTLVRAGRQVATTVDLVVDRSATGVSLDDLEEAVQTFFLDPIGFSEKQMFIGEASPESLASYLSTVLGVTVKQFNAFHRSDLATEDVQTILYEKNEWPSPLTLTIRF